MPQFQGKRIIHSYTQINSATPDKVFPLLCPVREVDWLPGWQHQMIYSQSGVAEKNCVFTTPGEAGTEMIWMVTDYDPAGLRLGYVWVQPEWMTAKLEISLTPEGSEMTRSAISFTYTGLSAAGNQALAGYDADWFQQKMQRWERSINFYLENGCMIGSSAARTRSGQ